MSTLIIAEHDHKHLHSAIHNVMQAAIALNQAITLLIVGNHCSAVVDEATQLAGIQNVLFIDDVAFEHPSAEIMGQLIHSIAQRFDYILMASSTYAKNILPRIAALLDVGLISDVMKVLTSDTFEHPIYAGNAIETVQALDKQKVLTIRAIAFEPMNEKQKPCPVEQLDFTGSSLTRFIDHQLSVSTRPELGHAKVVISGGRALQNSENFQLIEELADLLGGAVGASRAAVDAGFIANDFQVGQTGKIVAPTLYFAIGISGAVQHVAGMKDSKVIVAINKDPEAPIFQIATYGLVGDLFEIVPQLIRTLKNKITSN